MPITAKNSEDKAFNIRVPKYLWLFLKQRAASQEVSMTKIICHCIETYMKKVEKAIDKK